MFTGIILDIGEITQVEKQRATHITVRTKLDLSRQQVGDSVACSGICLTVISKDAASFSAELSDETLQRTHAANWQEGTQINLEPALRMGDALGGHLVTGHVDGMAELAERQEQNGSLWLRFTAPRSLSRFIAAKGSVTLDGVSLTVNEVAGEQFTVMLISHTQAQTTLQGLQAGDTVNLEIDLIARYLARLVEKP